MEPAHALGVTVAHLQDPPPPSRRAPSAQPECGLQRPGWGRPPSPCSRHPVRVPGARLTAARECRTARVAARQPDAAPWPGARPYSSLPPAPSAVPSAQQRLGPRLCG